MLSLILNKELNRFNIFLNGREIRMEITTVESSREEDLSAEIVVVEDHLIVTKIEVIRSDTLLPNRWMLS